MAQPTQNIADELDLSEGPEYVAPAKPVPATNLKPVTKPAVAQKPIDKKPTTDKKPFVPEYKTKQEIEEAKLKEKVRPIAKVKYVPSKSARWLAIGSLILSLVAIIPAIIRLAK